MRARRYWALFCVTCWPLTALAAFDPTDVVQIQATVGLSHDNNLFRLPELDPRLFGIDPANTADTMFTKGVGLKIDKLVSRQRLIADLNLSENTFDKNTNLDHVAGNGRLAWLWQAGNYWNGEASYGKSRRLSGFADFRRDIQDLIDTETYALTGGYHFHPRWRIAGELSEQHSTHSAAVRDTLDVNSKTAGLSLTYRTPANNSMGLQGRRTERHYPNRPTEGPITLDNNHIESRINVTGIWRPTEIFRVDGRVGHVDIEHERLSVRDFSGVTWQIGAIWDATSKFRLNVNGSRDIRLYEDIATSYIVVDSIAITPIYAITPKLSLQGELTHENRDYRGDPLFLLISQRREDRMRTARLTLSYSPLRYVDLSISYEAGERKSNIQLNNFEYQSWFGVVRVSF